MRINPPGKSCITYFLCHRIPTMINISPQKVMPPTPHQTPLNSRQGPHQAGAPTPPAAGHRSAPSSPSHHAYQGLGQRVSRVDMREALDFGAVKHQGVIPSGKIYVWRPAGDGKGNKTGQER